MSLDDPREMLEFIRGAGPLAIVGRGALEKWAGRNTMWGTLDLSVQDSALVIWALRAPGLRDAGQVVRGLMTTRQVWFDEDGLSTTVCLCIPPRQVYHFETPHVGANVPDEVVFLGWRTE